MELPGFNEAAAKKPRKIDRLSSDGEFVCGGFNEAAAKKPRKIRGGLNGYGARAGFNEAAAKKPRKILMARPPSSSSFSLQ